MLEHLHPNAKGYFLMGASFAQAMLESDRLNDLIIPSTSEISSSSDPVKDRQMDSALLEQEFKPYEERMYLSEFDYWVAYHRVRTLKQGFPFGSLQYYWPINKDINPLGRPTL